MILSKRIEVAPGERVLVTRRSRPVRYLGEGVHRLWRWPGPLTVTHHDTDVLLARLRPDELALVAHGDVQVVRLGRTERALVRRAGVPVLWLGHGEHAIWTVATSRRRVNGHVHVEKAIDVEIVDVSGVETAPLARELVRLVPSTDYVETTVPQGAVALRLVDGVVDAELGPGRHAAWRVENDVRYTTVDLRQRQLKVNAQEVMTSDRVSLRLNLAAEYHVADARRLVGTAQDADEVLYLAVQVAAREAVTSRSLDELLADRVALTEGLLAEVRARAEAVGLVVERVVVKDLVLPGEMRELLNRVIEARKEAEANVITRREEAAATRSLAQTAQVMADHPVLQRLKELEAYAELAERVGTVNLVVGEGVLPKIEVGTHQRAARSSSACQQWMTGGRPWCSRSPSNPHGRPRPVACVGAREGARRPACPGIVRGRSGGFFSSEQVVLGQEGLDPRPRWRTVVVTTGQPLHLAADGVGELGGVRGWDDLVMVTVDQEDRSVEDLHCPEVVEGITDEEARHPELRGEGPHAGEGRLEHERGQRPVTREHAGGAAAERASVGDDARGVDLGTLGQEVVGREHGRRDARLTRSSARATVARVLDEEQPEPSLSSVLDLADRVVDELAVAVGVDDDGAGRRSAGWKVEGLDRVGSELDALGVGR
ncbi:MAG: slipin family protein [Acidobacteriota bacterium]